jgi:hypothetical protein
MATPSQIDPLILARWRDQEQLAYDPLAFMPTRFPGHPRLLTNRAKLAETRVQLRRAEWGPAALARLRLLADADCEVPESLPGTADAAHNRALMRRALNAACYYTLSGERAYFDRALAAIRPLALAYPGWPIGAPNTRAAGGGISENLFTMDLARTSDLLAGGPLAADDLALLETAMHAALATCDAEPHRDCGNHNTSSTLARLSLGIALGEPQVIHDALYGCLRCELWRYGLVHHLEHDFLGDGTWWERTIGYHLFALYCLANAAHAMSNLGFNMLRRSVPAQETPLPLDLHRQYAPTGKRILQAAFDVPLYQACHNLDYFQTHDSRVTSMVAIPQGWGALYELLWQATHDKAYAWLLQQLEDRVPAAERRFPGLPLSLQEDPFAIELLRVCRPISPVGAFRWDEDYALAVSGRHERECSLFPDSGLTILRLGADTPQGVNAGLQWGPHAAGHQSPASLHLDLHAGGTLFTGTPNSDGYEDPSYLTWVRTTLAHNTVTLDQMPMAPYHLGGESIWEAENWHGLDTSGDLLGWQPASDFRAVRASNARVYPGATLDRTVILTPAYALDVMRVSADRPRQVDWAMHLLGRVHSPAGGEPVDLGPGLGYRHLTDAQRWVLGEAGQTLRWQRHHGHGGVHLLAPGETTLVLADEPGLKPKNWLLGPPRPEPGRFALLLRRHCQETVVVALWCFNEPATGPSTAVLTALSPFAATGDLTLQIRHAGIVRRWVLPYTARDRRIVV